MAEERNTNQEFDPVEEAQKLSDEANEATQKSADPRNTPIGRQQAEEQESNTDSK